MFLPNVGRNFEAHRAFDNLHGHWRQAEKRLVQMLLAL